MGVAPMPWCPVPAIGRDGPLRACALRLGNDPYRVDDLGSRMLRYSWGVAPSEPQVRNRNPLR